MATNERFARRLSAVALETIKEQLRARRKAKKANIRVAALNITSFLDMSFCLLMFLTLSAGGASIKEGVFTSHIGTGPRPDEIRIVRPINLTVSQRNDQYVIDIDATRQPVIGFEALAQALTQLRYDERTNPRGFFEKDSPVIIRSKGDVPWQGVIGAFNAAVRARFEKIGFGHAN
jgi:biopolymer transport protein ExbD